MHPPSRTDFSSLRDPIGSAIPGVYTPILGGWRCITTTDSEGNPFDQRLENQKVQRFELQPRLENFFTVNPGELVAWKLQVESYIVDMRPPVGAEWHSA